MRPLENCKLPTRIAAGYLDGYVIVDHMDGPAIARFDFECFAPQFRGNSHASSISSTKNACRVPATARAFRPEGQHLDYADEFMNKLMLLTFLVEAIIGARR